MDNESGKQTENIKQNKNNLNKIIKLWQNHIFKWVQKCAIL